MWISFNNNNNNKNKNEKQQQKFRATAELKSMILNYFKVNKLF